MNECFALGTGSMGTCVYAGIIDDGSEVAVKRMLIQTCEDAAENEKAMLALIDTKKSPFIVSYRHFLRDNIFMYLIVDLCEETLNDHIHSQSVEHVQEHGRRMIKEILTGLEILHDKGILHRDLKPSNVLVDVEGRMKLADFGLSRVLREGETTVLTYGKGTQGWMPPEVIETVNQGGKGRYKKKSDVQVAGMIAYFILTKGEHPFGSVSDRMTNILNGNPVNLEKLDDLDARQFVSKLISHEIDDRPHACEALGFHYINEEKKSELAPKPSVEKGGGTEQNFHQNANRSIFSFDEDENDHLDEDENDYFDEDQNDNSDEDMYDPSEYNDLDDADRSGDDEDYSPDEDDHDIFGPFRDYEDNDVDDTDYHLPSDDEHYSPDEDKNDHFDEDMYDPSEYMYDLDDNDPGDCQHSSDEDWDL